MVTNWGDIKEGHRCSEDASQQLLVKYSCSTNATIGIQEGSEQSEHLGVFCVRRVEREGEGREETRGKGG